MLFETVLDDERFVEIAERARAQIADIAPFWTDHNVHDPGMTILELFAWMKEMQQFHMDQIGKAHTLAYLRLMGLSLLKKKAAKAVVRLDGAAYPAFFPQGSRFYAGDVCFEAAEPIRIGAEEITRISAYAGGGNAARPEVRPCQNGETGEAGAMRIGSGRRVRVSREASATYDAPAGAAGDIRFPAFGERPEKGSALRMELSGALEPQVTHCLSIRLSECGAGRRNPIGEEDAFYPLSELSVRYRGEKEECTARLVEDTTKGLLQNGMLRFCLEQEMSQENGSYALWLVLERCEYDIPPMLAGITFHERALVQQRTVAEYHDGRLRGSGPIRLCTYLAMTGEFLLFRQEGEWFFPYDGKVEKKISDEAAFFFLPEHGQEEMAYRLICCERGKKEELLIAEGSGLPDQEYSVGMADLCAEGMCLMMETIKGSGRYVSAAPCDDLLQAGASDAVFCYEEESGSIRFGDCDHGIAPEGSIRIAAARSSLGVGGNVKEGSILRLEDGARGIVVENRYPAEGGRDAETVSQGEERLKDYLAHKTRAVTDEDYEYFARKTPGLMIENVRVLSAQGERDRDGTAGEACVTLAVKPVQMDAIAPLSEAYRKNILRALEKKRLLGTRIVVLSPEYIGISVYAEIVSAGQEQRARKEITAAAGKFFEKMRAAFGAAVRVSAVYGMLHVLDAVAEVVSLTLDAQGKGIRRSRNGDLILPANGLPYLRECVLSMSSGNGQARR
ncbi:MAG: baseplate J/gp47 family protein [bacterium]|nr:baseplate J/gp47 family protein [bacterium]